MANKKDYATSTVLTAPSPADSGTSLVVQSGHGARFPAAPFYITAHPPSEFPTLDNAEKILVTAKSTDTFTLDRAEDGTTAQLIEAGWRVSNALFLDDIPDTFDDLADGSTNKAFTGTEKTKLSGIETAADVTDSANVDAAGATMNTDTNVKANSWVIDEDNMSSNVDTKVPTQQSVKAYADSKVDGSYTSSTPTITTSTGSITTRTCQAYYKVIGKTVHYYGKITITNNGTGAGGLFVPLPVTAARLSAGVMYGREIAVTGKGVTGVMDTTGRCYITYAGDNTYPGGTGSNVIDFSITYEAA